MRGSGFGARRLLDVENKGTSSALMGGDSDLQLAYNLLPWDCRN
jgi:hypothetical protein